MTSDENLFFVFCFFFSHLCELLRKKMVYIVIERKIPLFLKVFEEFFIIDSPFNNETLSEVAWFISIHYYTKDYVLLNLMFGSAPAYAEKNSCDSCHPGVISEPVEILCQLFCKPNAFNLIALQQSSSAFVCWHASLAFYWLLCVFFFVFFLFFLFFLFLFLFCFVFYKLTLYIPGTYLFSHSFSDGL